MKILNGTELAGYIKAEQARNVRSLVQSEQIQPKLVIIQDNGSKLNEVYAKLKQNYASDIGVVCELVTVKSDELIATIKKFNKDQLVHGIIVQLPLLNPEITEDTLAHIDPDKDVDGLGPNAQMDPATPTAILWLLSGFNISLQGKSVAVVGQGRLVGKPLGDMLEASGISVDRYDEDTQNLKSVLLKADVIISATGQPGLIKPESVKTGAVVVDAGTAESSAGVVGDVADELYKRDDITITPKKGGVGPLTVAALFGNLLKTTRMLK